MESFYTGVGLALDEYTLHENDMRHGQIIITKAKGS